jgi:ribosomal protein L11 methylase PrmA
MQTRSRVPGSFRDPSGYLFYRDGLVYRQVNSVYAELYDQLVDSGLYQALADADLLIPHQEVEVEPAESTNAYKVIQPEQIPFISYPYEWSFSQLKDAALTTLEIQKRALEFEMSLKDCSAYNIQFRKGKPVFIDTLSFESYREGHPWVAYRQFCQHFLAPLALMDTTDVRLNQLLRVYIDGVPLDLASALLPARSRLSFALLSHIHLHARSQQTFAEKPVDVSGHKVSRLSFRGLIDNLERAVHKLKWEPQGTEWVDYTEDTNYSAGALQQKGELLSAFLDKTDSKVVWDLGANTGGFSRVAAGKGILTVSADVDPACVEVNYLRCVKERETNVLPLLLDLTNPSPGAGWESQERTSLIERGPADTVLALALVHHLAISNNLPLDRVAAFFSRICNWLIIEFVPKSDSQVQRLLLTREDIFPDYSQQAFERAFGRDFDVHESVRIEDSERTLYLMEKRSN